MHRQIDYKMVAHSDAAASQAPGIKPYFSNFEAIFSTKLACEVQYSSSELMIIRDRLS